MAIRTSNPFSSRGTASATYGNRTRPTSTTIATDPRLNDFLTDSSARDALKDMTAEPEEIDELLQEQLNSLSPLQNLLDKTGLTNFAGNIRANYKTAMEERAYNSVQAQTERMRQAGLNADLLGVQGTEDDSAGSMIEGMKDVASGAFIKNFGDSILSFATGVVGLAHNFISMSGASMSNELNALSAVSEGGSIGDSMIDALAGDFLNSGDPALSTVQSDAELMKMSDKFLDSITKEGTTDYFKHYVKSKRLRKLLNKGLLERLRSASGKRDFYNAIKDTYDSYFGAKVSQSKVSAAEQPVENGEIIGDFFDNIGNILVKSDYFTHLNEYLYQKTSNPELQAQSENANARYTRDFYNASDGETAGKASNSAYENQDLRQQYEKDVNLVKNELMAYAEKLRKEGRNAFERGLGAALPLVIPVLLGDIQMNIPPLPNVQRRQTNVTNYTTNNNSNTINSNKVVNN